MEVEKRHQLRNRVWQAMVLAVAMCVAAVGSFLLARSMPKPAQPRTSSREHIVAYYFHRTTRCPTCVRIESSVREAIEAAFAPQLKIGRLEWQAVDYEAVGNEHYAADYKLTGPCVVLVRMRSNQPVEWRSLPEVWECVGDKSALTSLVHRNVREFLDYLEHTGACCS